MAGEWIKVQGITPDKPEVLRMARVLGIDRDAVMGKLVRVWSWFDSNSVDGVVDGVVAADIDRVVAKEGFSSAMQDVGWLEADDEKEKLTLPNFDRHNGETAKKRALKNKRQARWRENSVDGGASTKASTREEKRREEYNYSEADLGFAKHMFECAKEVAPGTREPNFEKWASTVRLMRERDGLTISELQDVFTWANRDEFWKTNVLSPDKLRKQFPVLRAKAGKAPVRDDGAFV